MAVICKKMQIFVRGNRFYVNYLINSVDVNRFNRKYMLIDSNRIHLPSLASSMFTENSVTRNIFC